MVTWHEAGDAAALDPEEPTGIVVGGRPVGLYLVDGEVIALADWCPHQADVRLSEGWIEGGMIICPMHQSQFELRTGRCMGPPADEDVVRYPVRLESGRICVGIGSEESDCLT